MRLIFIGAINPEIVRMVAAARGVVPNLAVLGFIDNDPAKHGTHFYGFPVFGGVSHIPQLLAEDLRFVNLITGSAEARYTVTRQAIAYGAKFTNFIHHSVDLTMTTWGIGNYVQEGVIVQAGVRVGDNCSVHVGAIIGHESTIGNSSFIAHAVSISGCCKIGDGCFIGTNSTILPRVTIGAWSIVGAGSVVTKDIPAYSVVVGNPARIIRTNDVPYVDGDIVK